MTHFTGDRQGRDSIDSFRATRRALGLPETPEEHDPRPILLGVAVIIAVIIGAAVLRYFI